VKLVISGVPGGCARMSSPQSSFRNGVAIKHNQIDPLVLAIQMPRVYLLVACRAGPVVRHRARRQVQDWVSF
jgi:hypothetical protein